MRSRSGTAMAVQRSRDGDPMPYMCQHDWERLKRRNACKIFLRSLKGGPPTCVFILKEAKLGTSPKSLKHAKRSPLAA